MEEFTEQFQEIEDVEDVVLDEGFAEEEIQKIKNKPLRGSRKRNERPKKLSLRNSEKLSVERGKSSLQSRH